MVCWSLQYIWVFLIFSIFKLTVVADRIARVYNTSSTTHNTALDIYVAFDRVMVYASLDGL